MSHFSCSIAMGSQDVREDPYDIVKKHDQCLVFFPYGIDAIFMDISMHRIEIIKIK